MLVPAIGIMQANAPAGPVFLILTPTERDEEKARDGASEGPAPLTGPRGFSKVTSEAPVVSLAVRVPGP